MPSTAQLVPTNSVVIGKRTFNPTEAVERGTQNSPLPPSVETAYYRKCIELKRRVNEIEESNDAARTRKIRVNRQILKMRLERAFLLEQLQKRMEYNVDDSDRSSSPPPTPQDKPLRSKRGHRKTTPPAAGAAVTTLTPGSTAIAASNAGTRPSAEHTGYFDTASAPPVPFPPASLATPQPSAYAPIQPAQSSPPVARDTESAAASYTNGQPHAGPERGYGRYDGADERAASGEDGRDARDDYRQAGANGEAAHAPPEAASVSGPAATEAAPRESATDTTADSTGGPGSAAAAAGGFTAVNR